MKKVIAIIGSQRKGTTYRAVQEFERNLKLFGEIDFEYVFLNDYNLDFCRGCKLCFDRGEEYCPIKDDRDKLLEKLENADGVILATPSYAFQVSARMKNLIDRITFIFHRPRFFGKTFTALVIHAVPIGAVKIRKYLESTGSNFGFHVVKGCCVCSMEPMTEKEQSRMKEKIEKTSRRYYKNLSHSELPAPSFFRLMAFRMHRSGLQSTSARYYDYDYFKEKGWFESDYYHETVLGPIKRIAGHLFDFAGRQMFKNS